MKEVIAFFTGYFAITLIGNGPSWAGMIGGWVLAGWINLGLKK